MKRESSPKYNYHINVSRYFYIFLIKSIDKEGRHRERRGYCSTARCAPASLCILGSSPGESESGRQTGLSSADDQLPAPLHQLISILLLLRTLASGRGRHHWDTYVRARAQVKNSLISTCVIARNKMNSHPVRAKFPQ